MEEIDRSLRVLIVSEHASAQFGGEAVLPLHYFRVLRRRGYNVWMVVHARTRDELAKLFPGDPNIVYVEDLPFNRLMVRVSSFLPSRVALFTVGFVVRLLSQRDQRRIARRLIAREGISIVHQPMPVSPREPSLMHGLGVPVVIGPMNGGMDFPPAFRRLESPLVRATIGVGRGLSNMLNRLMPGKLKSELLLVANERTRRALPKGVQGAVVEVVENGVDLSVWVQAGVSAPVGAGAVLRFIFMGRLVDWKAVDLLLPAFRAARDAAPMSLVIAGDGPERPRLEAMVSEWGMLAATEGEPGKVFFAGWLSQPDCSKLLRRCDALVLPSLLECGGAVVLEAMAAARPVIATHWGGPADYLDPSCGILVPPTSRDEFVDGLKAAMIRLAGSPELCRAMGQAGYRKVLDQFDWEAKVDRVLDLFREVARGGHSTPAALQGGVGRSAVS